MKILDLFKKKEKTITISYNKQNLPYIEEIKDITSKQDIEKAIRVLETLKEFEPEREIKHFSVDNRPTPFHKKQDKSCIDIKI